MDQTSNIQTADAAYDAAHAKLMHLIDIPEKHLPVAEYLAHIHAAQNARALAYKELVAARHG
jgi:hypothetical protein